VEPEAENPEADDFAPDTTHDQHIGMNVKLAKGDSMLEGSVIDRKRDRDGNPIGVRSDNHVYGLWFSSGAIGKNVNLYPLYKVMCIVLLPLTSALDTNAEPGQMQRSQTQQGW
jgi:hypothetical protein